MNLKFGPILLFIILFFKEFAVFLKNQSFKKKTDKDLLKPIWCLI